MESRMALPQDYLERMKNMLKEEYPFFLAALAKEEHRALRRNTLKIHQADFEERLPFFLKKVPWVAAGYFYSKEEQPGSHPFHQAGLYYIQEPSAMAAAEYLEARPGEKVLDLCAAPGGKSTQIAGALQGKGLLVCNEPHPARVRILSENIERMGIKNALVTNELPHKLAAIFPEYFDKILVDAPCSGEGMFRRNEEACGQWSIENVKMCASRQDEILKQAAGMLKPGGRLVYSTCTFAPEENEGSIFRFLAENPQFHLIKAKKYEGMEAGRPEWSGAEEERSKCGRVKRDGTQYGRPEWSGAEGDRSEEDRLLYRTPEEIRASADTLKHTIRLWPHKIEGEGHFIAVLEKEGEPNSKYQALSINGLEKTLAQQECKVFLEFAREYLRMDDERWSLFLFGEQLYQLPEEMPGLKGLKVLRPGLHLGTLKKNRFEPSHALALSLHQEQVRLVYRLKADSPETKAYLAGQTFEAKGEKGWYLITIDGYSLGWGKLAGGIMKNHYPKGLRRTIL